jgi:xeroderma pigmentosum group C-complementing protein
MGTPNQDASRLCTRSLPYSSPAAVGNVVSFPALLKDNTQDSVNMNQQGGGHGKSRQISACKRSLSKTLSSIKKADNESSSISASSQLPSTSGNAEVPKRKGDVEFELQLEMALSATAAETQNNNQATHMSQSISSLQDSTPPMKKLRQNTEPTSSSSAVWSRSAGAPLYWAEVYCSGQASTGRWVHADVVNDLLDAERKVEASSAVCKKPLRYVVAFAGNGAKDVTRRFAFCTIPKFVSCASDNDILVLHHLMLHISQINHRKTTYGLKVKILLS